MITDLGLPYFVHLSSDSKWLHFDPPYSEGPGEYNITLQLASDGLYTISNFFLKVINTPPFNVSDILNTQFYTSAKSYYKLTKNKDPEGNIVNCTFLNISSPMESYFSFSPITKIFTFFPDQSIFSG